MNPGTNEINEVNKYNLENMCHSIKICFESVCEVCCCFMVELDCELVDIKLKSLGRSYKFIEHNTHIASS